MKLGVDLGGTKIEAIVLDGEGAPLWRQRVATPQGDYEGTLAAIQALTEQAKQATGLSSHASVGIGTPGTAYVVPGTVTPVMKNCNSTVLNGKPLPQDLEARLGTTVYVANDANCFALAEALSGQGAKHDVESVFGVILGTGVGGGVVVHGRSLTGTHGIAGEWGHNMLPASALDLLLPEEKGRQCYCGRRDCIETYLSGPGLVMSYTRRYGGHRTSAQIVDAMRDGDSKAVSVWQAYRAQLACALSYVVNILDPGLIVLGGGMSTIPELYPGLIDEMAPYLFTPDISVEVLPALLGDSAGVYGAAWLNPGD